MLLALILMAACRSKPVVVEPPATATNSTTDAAVTVTPMPPLSEAGTDSKPAVENEVDDEPVGIEATAGPPDNGTVDVEEQVELVEEPNELVICMAEEPETLYPLSRARPSMATRHVLQGIYENMFTTLGYDYQARGIVKMPSLADGDANIKTVRVDDGDMVLDVNEDVVTLREGVTVRTADGEEVTFEDTPLRMPQMDVQFTLQPLTWSDGTPVTADDSVFSFELAADPETPLPKTKIERTSSYKATGDLTLEWTAVPGYLDPTYFTNIWTPYPRHEWGEYLSEELLEAEASTRMPLSHGPYLVSEWVEGDHLTLVRNDNYYLADEGLPKVDAVHFRFIPDSSELVAQLI
jgi:peptide/nickel transport system substrate-binding protein